MPTICQAAGLRGTDSIAFYILIIRMSSLDFLTHENKDGDTESVEISNHLKPGYILR